MTDTHGSFIWYELMVSDPKAAESFYSAVFGWDAADSGMPGIDYTLFSAKGTRVAGLAGPPAGVEAIGPAWIGYIATKDVDGTAEAILKAGGQVKQGPGDIPGVGRFALVADPQGAIFGLFKGIGEPPEMPSRDTPGLFAWRELHAGNGPDAFEFYSGLFDWRKGEGMDMGPMGTYQIYGQGELDYGGMLTKSPAFPQPSWLYYVNVDDIAAAADRIAANGGKVLMGPQEVPGGIWIVQGSDPQGIMFAVVGPKV